MAVTSSAPANAPPPRRRPRLFWSRLHFAIRLLGLLGVLAASVALVMAVIQIKLSSPNRSLSWLDALWQAPQQLRQFTVEQASQEPRLIVEQAQERWRLTLLAVGAAAAVFALLVEAVVILCFSATRRSAFGVNAVVQGALAAVLLIAVNVWSFWNYEQIDFTRDRQFTLPAEVHRDLAQLDPNTRTTIIVYNRHKVFGLTQDKDKPQDDYDKEAQRKVIEKVHDLVEQFSTFGPHFKVEVLDTESREYKERFREVTREIVRGHSGVSDDKLNRKRLDDEEASLRKTIEAAPENSLFFCARGENDKLHVQRLSFNDFYFLDKTASQDDRDGRGNLVLLYQGVEPIARRLLHLEERRPRVGIAVIHPILSSDRDHDWGLHGLRAALEKRGFEVQDIILKKWTGFGPPPAAAATLDESLLERLDERQNALETNIRNLERARPRLKERYEEFHKAITDPKKREELSRRYADQLDGGKLTVEDVQTQALVLRLNLENVELALPSYQQRLNEVKEEKSKLNVPALREQQRMTDVQAKMSRLLADCDVLMVPRMTLRNVADRERIPAWFYHLEESQVQAIKDFLKSGKPMLACFGPENRPPNDRQPPPAGEDQPDRLEKLLGELGIKFGKQTVLFDREVEGLADARVDLDLGSVQLEPPPPVLFDWQMGVGYPLAHRPASDHPNRIRRSLQLDARALGRDSDGKPIPLDLRIRHPRPIYYVPPKGSKPLAYDPDFLMTDPRSWNEDQPFPTSDRIPQFERPASSDKSGRDLAVGKDALESRRRGPFPIGVALDAPLPASWYASAGDTPPTVRVAAIGQGGFFTGKSLPPAEEKLFVDTINWLLGRDEQLPVADQVWSYPRVNETIAPDSEAHYLWVCGALLGLPALFASLGMMVWLFRRLR